ncbi:MAG: hypothetical protein ABIQ31_12920 [Ferruginibacter sp.]
MKIKILVGLLFPLMVMAQEVKPVLSADYLSMVRKDPANFKNNKGPDSTNSIDKAIFRYQGPGFSGGFTVKKIHAGAGNIITFRQAFVNDLSITGTVSAAIELRHVNHLPSLQNEYVQGRSASGTIIWRGPETNELFSYGPSINTLNFDGTNYPYDLNGRLTAAGAGNGKKAIAYGPSIFHTAALFSHAITLQTNYRQSYQRQLNSIIKAGQRRENSIVSTKNKTDYFSVSLEGILKQFTIGGSYNYRQERLSNCNQNGFLNKVYRNALLSPVSFDNSQGSTIGSMQRSYSAQADNPYFLLAGNDHLFLQHQNTGNFVLEQKFSGGKIRLSQSYENFRQQSNEGYRPGTAFFPNGVVAKRNTTDDNYLLTISALYNIRFTDPQFSTTVTANYIYNNKQSAIINSQNPTYNYQRSSNDIALGFAPTYRNYDFAAGISLVNKMYASNTATTDNFLLPSVSGFIRFNDLFLVDDLSVKLAGAYTRFNSEPALNKSFAQANLLRYSMIDALQYLPLTEVNGFDNLRPVEHKEYTTSVELSYKNKLSLVFDWFNRKTYNDIFPIIKSGQLELENIATHRNRGFELELKFYPYPSNGKMSFSNSISFATYRSSVLDVKAGYNFTPIAGFSDVHKTIIKGEPLGVIVGNTFLKDINNNIIIGTDGFPLVSNNSSIIGNPIPDFTIKLNNHFSWRKCDLNIDWEWKKGGDMWNGTAAMLDYYGRSANSAGLRNTVNYLFNGVQENGAHNMTPVNFYDPSQPLEKNRWVRYGPAGVAESYIEKADCIRLNNISVSYKALIKKYLQQLVFTLYANNIMLWQAYDGVDPGQLMYGQPGSTGLDLFNLPSYRSFGFSVSLKF